MEDIEKLSNRDLASKLKCLGLKSGPITKATRKVFESLLRKYYEERNTNGDEIEKMSNESFEQTDEKSEQPIVSNSKEFESDKLQAGSANDAVEKDTGVYYSICRSVCPSSTENTSNISPLVCTSLDHALRLMKSTKGARLKMFTTKNEAEKFSLSSYEEPTIQISQSNEPVIPYKSPTPQELVIFRKKIENGEIDLVKSSIYENPKYLVSSVELPVILQEGSRYNAMHVAVKSNQLKVCQIIIYILDDDELWKLMFPINNDSGLFEKRKRRMMDYYLNSPDKGAGDTPLHLACKFGFSDIVKLLVSMPLVEKERVNKFGERATDVVCSRLNSHANAAPKKREIMEYFDANFFVPLLRAEDNSVDAVLGDPVQINTDPCIANAVTQSPVSPLNPKLVVRAYAGPMSPKQADDFIHEWRSPQRKNFMNDFEKGKERIGRKLSMSHKVPWREYWSFLGCFTDLASEMGLNLLEQYFKNELTNYQKNDIDIYATPARGKQLFSGPSNLNYSQTLSDAKSQAKSTVNTRLSFEEQDENMNNYSNDEMKMKKDDECKKNLYDAFSQKSPTERTSSKSSGSIENEDGMNRNEAALGSLKSQISPLSSSQTHAMSQGCNDIDKMMQNLSLNSENIVDGSTQQQVNNMEDNTTKIHRISNEYSSESSAEDCTIEDHSEYHIKSVSVGDAVFDSDTNDSLSLSSNSVFGDTPFQNSQIKKTNEKLTRTVTSSKSRRFDDFGTSLFIKGMFPSKLDFDVYRALEGVLIEKTKYPHIARWMHKVNTYSNEDKNRWPSPCSPRFRSKLRLPDALWSL